MKKIFTPLLLMVVLVFFSEKSKAQTTFQPGDNIIGLGIGLAGGLYTAGATSSIPPIGATYEHGLNIANFGLGAFIGIAGATYDYPYNDYYNGVYYGRYEYSYVYKVIGIRGAYHFYTKNKFDVYAGLMLGYDAVSYTYTGPSDGYYGYNATGSGFAFDIFLGGRYYVSPHIALGAEIGYGVDLLAIGVSFKL